MLNSMTKQNETTPSVSNIEQLRLDFEKEKNDLEEKWKKRTFIWTVTSSLLTTLISLLALLPKSSSQTEAIKLSLPQVESCQESLERLPVLSKLTNQSVSNLDTAINTHKNVCEVLVTNLKEYILKVGAK